MARLTFNAVYLYAKSKGLTVHTINRKCDGITYRYEVFKTGAVVADCSTLAEVVSEINHWIHD